MGWVIQDDSGVRREGRSSSCPVCKTVIRAEWPLGVTRCEDCQEMYCGGCFAGHQCGLPAENEAASRFYSRFQGRGA